MILCIDIGNTQIYGAFYLNDKFLFPWRINTKENWDIDKIGLYFTEIIKERGINIPHINFIEHTKHDLKQHCVNKTYEFKKNNEIYNDKNIGYLNKNHLKNSDFNEEIPPKNNFELQKIIISSVVPSIEEKVKQACINYLHINPFFINLEKVNIINIQNMMTRNFGTDIICNIVAATEIFKDENIIIIDMGTATTITVIDKDKKFLSGIIMPGIKTQMEAIANSAEQLSVLEVIKPENILNDNTDKALQAGIYYGHLGSIQFITNKIKYEKFGGNAKVIGTGGNSGLFKSEKIFDLQDSELILKGMIYIMNH